MNNKRLIEWIEFIQNQLDTLNNSDSFNLLKFKRLYHALTLTIQIVEGKSKLVGANCHKLNK